MRTLGLLLLVLLLAVQTGNAQKLSKKERKEQKAAEIKELIESGTYVFKATSANPMAGRRIDLTSEYDLKMDGNQAEAWLPYFGRAYQAAYGTGDGGVKFKEEVKDIKVEFNEKKKSYNIEFQVKAEKDTYTLYLSVGESGYATLNVNSNNRQPISYYGEVVQLEKEDQ